MNFVDIKKEAHQFDFHLAVKVNNLGALISIDPTQHLDTPELKVLRFDSDCPACQSLLTVKIILHDSSDNTVPLLTADTVTSVCTASREQMKAEVSGTRSDTIFICRSWTSSRLFLRMIRWIMGTTTLMTTSWHQSKMRIQVMTIRHRLKRKKKHPRGKREIKTSPLHFFAITAWKSSSQERSLGYTQKTTQGSVVSVRTASNTENSTL